MRVAAFLLIALFSSHSLSQTRPVLTEKLAEYSHRDKNTFDQILYFYSDYHSSDYEYLFNHKFQAVNDIQMSTFFGNRLLFGDIDKNGITNTIGNTEFGSEVKVGYAEYRSDEIPIFSFMGNFPPYNISAEKVIDLNNDGFEEILIKSSYPYVNVFADTSTFIRSLPVSSQWGNQQTLIEDIDGNTKVDFIIDQFIENYSINFYEYDYLQDSLFLISTFDSLMTRIIVSGNPVDTLLKVTCCFSDYVYGDLDNNGFPEIAAAHMRGFLNVFEKQSDGYKQVHFDNLLTLNMYQIAITNDIDLNGKKEIIVMGNYDGGPLYWIETDDEGSYFIKRSAFIDYGPNISILDLEFYATDVDLDERDELIFIGKSRIWVLKWDIIEDKWDVFFYLNVNTEYMDLWGNNSVRNFPGTITNVEFFDIDNDGDKDMFISTSDGVTLYFESTLNVSEVKNTFQDYLPLKFNLVQNYPNPFNPVTKINYALPSAAMVELKVYNVLGQLITTLVNEEKPAGFYEIDFNAADFPSGVYMYKLQAGDYVQTKKMILLK